MSIRLKLLASAALTAVAFATPALAGDQAKIDRLEKRVKELERMVERMAGPEGQAAPAPAALEQRVSDLEIAQGARLNALETKANEVQWSFSNGRPTISTGDGRFSMALRGRFHFDAGLYSQDPGVDVPYVVDGGNVRDLGAGSFFRRAQFGVEGKAFRDFDYEMRFNFGGSETEEAGSINIMRVAYNPTPYLRINAGAIQPTFTLDDSTSSNDITFLERAAVVNALIGEFGGSDSRKGVEVTYLKDDFMINAAYTTSTIGARNAGADDRDHLLGRIAWRPYSDSDWDIHVGANAATILSMGGVDKGAGLLAARTLNFRDRPELRIAGERLVATGNIAAESAWMWGLEGAARYKNFYLAGEYFQWGVDRDRECAGCSLVAPDPDFSGYYVMASYILTGETKRYGANGFSNSRMQFGAPRPNSPFSTGGTWGAWELAARYSAIDLNYNVNPTGLPVLGAPIAAEGEIRGGEQKIVTVGLNWYLNSNIRLMFQYQNVDVNRISSTALNAVTNPGTPSAAYPDIGQSFDTFAVRTQFQF